MRLEARAAVHWPRFLPRHASPPRAIAKRVTHVPGLFCYLCARFLPFPKYRIEFTDKAQTTGTPFQGHKKIRVNSHCGNGGPDDVGGQLDRIQNESSPIREELAYRILRAAGVSTYRTRLGKIAYQDTSVANPLAPIERHGLLIESGNDAVKRFKRPGIVENDDAVYLNDPGPAPATQSAGASFGLMNVEDILRVHLAESLLGNEDWALSMDAIGNVDVFGVANQGIQLPIPQDFDLSSVVQSGRDPSASVIVPLTIFRYGFRAEDKSAVAEEFIAARSAIESEIALVEREGIAAGRIPSRDNVTTTDRGFLNAHEQVRVFYNFIINHRDP